LGVVQFLVVLGCFAGIALCSLRIIRHQSYPFLFFTGAGAVCFLTIQMFFNVAVITGLLPTKGIALPFLSYGGSSLLSSFCLLGLVVNVSRELYSPLRQLRCLSSACKDSGM
jgi:cell division protein FtsW